jgi:hypothetical protein
MARPPAFGSVSRNFYAALNSAVGLASAIRPFCARNWEGIRENPIHPSQARRVIALSFLAATAAWEEFLGAVFVRYVAGASSASGYRPTLLMGRAPSLDHAYKLVAGRHDYDPESRFLTWGPDETLARVRLFFRSGSAFENAIKGANRQLKDASIIRNRVAHASQKCRTDFIDTARRLLQRTQLGRGYGVGDLLLAKPPLPLHRHPRSATYLDAFLFMFHGLADEIAPGEGERYWRRPDA